MSNFSKLTETVDDFLNFTQASDAATGKASWQDPLSTGKIGTIVRNRVRISGAWVGSVIAAVGLAITAHQLSRAPTPTQPVPAIQEPIASDSLPPIIINVSPDQERAQLNKLVNEIVTPPASSPVTNGADKLKPRKPAAKGPKHKPGDYAHS